jgi:Protein of unknown function (DUF938)
MDVARRMIMLHRSIGAMRQMALSSRVRAFLHIPDTTRLPASPSRAGCTCRRLAARYPRLSRLGRTKLPFLAAIAGENATALVFDVVRGFLVHLGPGGYGQATRCRSQHRLPAARTSVTPRMNQAARTAPAARNREPILRVLRDCLPPSARVLEIASGTGERMPCGFAARCLR